VLDSLLSGGLWIPLVGALLAGIVFFNVDLLRINRGIAETSRKASTVKRQNAKLRTEIARLVRSERIQRAAAQRGLVFPAAHEIRYLKAHPAADARRAAQRIEPPAPAPAPAPIVQPPPTPAPASGTTPGTVTPTTPAPGTGTTTPTAPAAAATPPAPSTTAPTTPAQASPAG
jgi:hypothetical protein